MDDLTDNEWKWVAPFLRDPDDPSAGALRGYLNDRIAERLVTARAEERERIRGPVAQRFNATGSVVMGEPPLTVVVSMAIRGTLKWMLHLIDEDGDGQ